MLLLLRPRRLLRPSSLPLSDLAEVSRLRELSRQYQCALEHERLVRSRLEGVLSAEDEMRDVEQETLKLREMLSTAWLDFGE